MILTPKQAQKLLNTTWKYLQTDSVFSDEERSYKTIADNIVLFFNEALNENNQLSALGLDYAEKNLKEFYNSGASNFTNKIAILCGFILLKSDKITIEEFKNNYWTKTSPNKKDPNRFKRELLTKYLNFEQKNSDTLNDTYFKELKTTVNQILKESKYVPYGIIPKLKEVAGYLLKINDMVDYIHAERNILAGMINPENRNRDNDEIIIQAKKVITICEDYESSESFKNEFLISSR